MSYELNKKTVYVVVNSNTEKAFSTLEEAKAYLEYTIKPYNVNVKHKNCYIIENVVYIPEPKLVSESYTVEYRTAQSDVWKPTGDYSVACKESARITSKDVIRGLPSDTQFRFKITNRYADNQEKITYEAFTLS